MHLNRLLTVILMASLLSGCMTIGTVIDGPTQHSEPHWPIYSGTRTTLNGGLGGADSWKVGHIDVLFQILDFPLSMFLDTALLPLTVPFGLMRPLPRAKDLSQYKDWTLLLSREPGQSRWQAQAIRAKVGSLVDFSRRNQEMSKEERLVPMSSYESKEAAQTAIERLIDQRHPSPP